MRVWKVLISSNRVGVGSTGKHASRCNRAELWTDNTREEEINESTKQSTNRITLAQKGKRKRQRRAQQLQIETRNSIFTTETNPRAWKETRSFKPQLLQPQHPLLHPRILHLQQWHLGIVDIPKPSRSCWIRLQWIPFHPYLHRYTNAKRPYDGTSK